MQKPAQIPKKETWLKSAGIHRLWHLVQQQAGVAVRCHLNPQRIYMSEVSGTTTYRTLLKLSSFFIAHAYRRQEDISASLQIASKNIHFHGKSFFRSAIASLTKNIRRSCTCIYRDDISDYFHFTS